MELRYETRDEKGNDIIKFVPIKEYPVETVEFFCPVCRQQKYEGSRIKKIVSSKFTDWAFFVGDMVCTECSRLFSLYFYSYIVDPDGIHLLNVRQLRDRLCQEQKPPFLFVITTTQKKHLFYRSVLNMSSRHYAVNLETETIYTSPERMMKLLDFVELMQTLGAGKIGMTNGEIPFAVIQKTGYKALEVLQNELKASREIQIPLYCGQKRDIPEEEALCCLISLLTTI